jgi:hypothetical protein
MQHSKSRRQLARRPVLGMIERVIQSKSTQPGFSGFRSRSDALALVTRGMRRVPGLSSD